MALVDSTRGVKLILKVGNGASPEVFTAMCSINAERGLTFSSTVKEDTIPDCTDPDKIAWVVRQKESLSVAFSGGGMLHKLDVAKFDAWFRSEDPKNCQVILDDDDADRLIQWAGAFHLSDFEITGNRAERVATKMTLASDGVVTPTFGADVAAA